MKIGGPRGMMQERDVFAAVRCRAAYFSFLPGQASSRFPADYFIFFTTCRTFFVEFFFPACVNFCRRISSGTRSLCIVSGPIEVMGNYPAGNFLPAQV
ncbi:MAG: hypothetical protein M0P70_05215 [Desulfobulbaceae bacterium]|nr:hypothetical protein [Desulfobulbaceae bacterium]